MGQNLGKSSAVCEIYQIVEEQECTGRVASDNPFYAGRSILTTLMECKLIFLNFQPDLGL